MVGLRQDVGFIEVGVQLRPPPVFIIAAGFPSPRRGPALCRPDIFFFFFFFLTERGVTHSSGFKKQAVTGEEWGGGAAEPLKALFKQVLLLSSSSSRTGHLTQLHS